MALQFSNLASLAMMGDASHQGLLGYISTNAYFIFYTGSSPTSGGPETGTLPTGALNAASTVYTASAWTNTGSGVITASTVTSGSANATGTAASWVLFTSGGAPICEGSAGTSGADINFNNTSFVSGGTIAISSLTLTYSPH